VVDVSGATPQRALTVGADVVDVPERAAIDAARTPDLVARASAGERAALEQVLATLAPSIHRFARRMCRNEHDADDVLQDTMVAVARHLADWKQRGSMSSWVFAITRSVCARHRRRHAAGPRDRAADALMGQADAGADPAARLEASELGRVVAAGLDALPEVQREVIALRDVEGLSAAETAAALGISVDAVKSRLHRAREALRGRLRPVLEPKRVAGAGCPDVGLLWSQKLEGELTQADCANMERHMAGCAACAAACDALKRVLSACSTVDTPAVPRDLQARVKAAARAWVAPTT
jgi:RNA polymerase sigma-70 factor (ECF subfamily)